MGELNEGGRVSIGNSASRDVNGLIGQTYFQTGWSGTFRGVDTLDL